jgi:hypothetical protein
MNALRTLMTRASAVLFVLAAIGCALNLPPVPVEGTPEDLAPLAGEWSGWYVDDQAAEPGGSIAFTLAAGSSIAYGDVLMTRRGSQLPYGRYDPDRPSGYVLDARSQSLTILVVRALDGRVVGELDPYWDFDRECQALTTFTGLVNRDVIEGRYETIYRGPYARRTGTWRVWKTPSK